MFSNKNIYENLIYEKKIIKNSMVSNCTYSQFPPPKKPSNNILGIIVSGIFYLYVKNK
jgi:hypothetical protein